MTKEANSNAGRSWPRPDLTGGCSAQFSGEHFFWATSMRYGMIDRHPDARFVIDHMAILQPNAPPAPPQPWADLPKVVELAKRKNAVIKISGACTLSKEPYPFPDIWTRLPAFSMPGVSIVACGARTGREPSLSSITNRPLSLS